MDMKSPHSASQGDLINLIQSALSDHIVLLRSPHFLFVTLFSSHRRFPSLFLSLSLSLSFSLSLPLPLPLSHPHSLSLSRSPPSFSSLSLFLSPTPPRPSTPLPLPLLPPPLPSPSMANPLALTEVRTRNGNLAPRSRTLWSGIIVLSLARYRTRGAELAG